MTTAGPRRVPQGRAKIDNNRTLVAQLELTDLTPSKQLLMMKLYTVPMVGLLPVAPCSMLSGGLQFIAVFCYSRFNYPCTRYEKPDHPCEKYYTTRCRARSGYSRASRAKRTSSSSEQGYIAAALHNN